MLSSSYSSATKGIAYEDAIARTSNNGHTDIVVQLLDRSPDSFSQKEELWQDVLCRAARNNHRQLVLKALEKGAQINGPVKGPRDETPIF